MNEWCYLCYCEEITLDKDYRPWKLYLHINPLYRWPAELESPSAFRVRPVALPLHMLNVFPTLFCSMV